MFSSLLSVLAVVCLGGWMGVDAHTVLTYPGWRGDNLVTNDTFPYGMQWMYPCEYFFRLVLKEGPRRDDKRAAMGWKGGRRLGLFCFATLQVQTGQFDLLHYGYVELLLLLLSHLKGRQGLFRFTSFPSLLYLSLSKELSSFLTPNSHPPPHRTQLTTPRRRHAHNHKPHPLAHNRRRHLTATGLVPRPRNRLLLYEHGLRHRRARQRTTQHVVPHGARLPNRRALQEPLSRNILPTASASAQRSADAERRGQCDDPGCRDGGAWCCVVLLRRHHLRRPERRGRGQRDKLLQQLRHLLQQRLLDRARRHHHLIRNPNTRLNTAVTHGAARDRVDGVAMSLDLCSS